MQGKWDYEEDARRQFNNHLLIGVFLILLPLVTLVCLGCIALPGQVDLRPEQCEKWVRYEPNRFRR